MIQICYLILNLLKLGLQITSVRNILVYQFQDYDTKIRQKTSFFKLKFQV